MRRSCGPKARVIPVWTMCTPQIRRAIAPPRSTSVRVVSILRAPCRTQSAYPLISSQQGDQHTAIRPQKGVLHSRVNQFADETGKFLFETSLAEHSKRNNGALSTKEPGRGGADQIVSLGKRRDQRTSPRVWRPRSQALGISNILSDVIGLQRDYGLRLIL